ncbi:putative transposon Ty5-1 protein [Phytophthora infestans]|uniref:Putative transposon Ty5-1 protein n=1 Tax=Phytophthora infestans TaxID=4787 RepID=A0A833X2T0_PHYIN|nr:putative transposon Ty5-1 protein [Phytophthora infestans]
MKSTKHLHNKDNEPFYDTSMIREIIGSLLWLSTCTQLDITMTVNYLARFVSEPTAAHWMRALRYLRGTRELKLFYMRPQAPRKTIKTAIFSDADWAGDKDAKSTSGGLHTMNNMLIGWYIKKQSTGHPLHRKFHFIRDAIRQHQVAVCYCPTTEMKADILTKPLAATLHRRNFAKIKLVLPKRSKQ